MSAEVFWDSTLRQVDQFLDAARWRTQRDARLVRYAAWYTALLQRIQRLPALSKVMGSDGDSRQAPRRQSAAEQKAYLLAWKRSEEMKAAAARAAHGQ
jgi:hypothetical protein